MRKVASSLRDEGDEGRVEGKIVRQIVERGSEGQDQTLALWLFDHQRRAIGKAGEHAGLGRKAELQPAVELDAFEGKTSDGGMMQWATLYDYGVYIPNSGVQNGSFSYNATAVAG